MTVLNDATGLVWHRLAAIRAQVADLADLGATIPDHVARTLDNLDVFERVIDSPPPPDDLLAAIATGDADTIADALAKRIALTSALASDRMPVWRDVAPLLDDLDQALTGMCSEALDACAARYNKHAARLHELHNVVDVTQSGDALAVAGATKAQQQAWVEAREHRAALEDAHALLLGLASRAGLWWTNLAAEPGSAPVHVPARALAAAADCTKVDPDQALDAWEADAGDLGRFGAVLALGATLRAPATPEAWKALADQVPQRAALVITKVETLSPRGVRGFQQWRHRAGTPPETGELL